MKTGEDEEGYIFTNKILAGFEWNISRTAMYNHKYIQRLVFYIYFYIIYFFINSGMMGCVLWSFS